MNKKILYGIFFVSIFLLSTASMVQPVRGYEWGVPKEAIGVTSESEVKVYDEDGIDDHLGKKVDIEWFKAGDSDVVGAKGKSKYLEMETDEDLIDFEEEWVYGAAGFDDAYPVIQGALYAVATLGASASVPPIIYIINGSTWLTVATLAGIGWDFADVMTAGADSSDAEALALQNLVSYDDAMSVFADSYDGSILTRDLWDFTDQAYKSKPDDKNNEVPFLADPRDWFSSYQNVEAFGQYITGYIGGILSELDSWITPLMLNTTALIAVNQTLDAQLNVDATLKATVALLGGGNLVIGCYHLAYFVLGQVIAEVNALIPDKFGYLWQLLWEGLPTYVPQADFLKRMLKEFDWENDFDGDRLFKIDGLAYGKDITDATGMGGPDGEISAIPYGSVIVAPVTSNPIALPGETIYVYAYPTLEIETSTITIEIEYIDDYIDPADLSIFGGDNEDELEDWEVVFPYGDTGTQGTVSIQDGDEIIAQWGGIDQIPGFEISIILGASAISIIGLIYVIMKKRKM
jgi:hypothetical protein